MFGEAQIKGEGQFVDFDTGKPIFEIGKPPEKPEIETTYVERRIPVFLEKAAHDLIDKFLADHGYNPEEI